MEAARAASAGRRRLPLERRAAPGETLTWSEWDTAAREIAAGLVARGVVPGERVCVLSQTRPEWVSADVGILLAGGVTVPIYPSNTAEQCEYIIRDSGAKIVFVEDATQLDKLLPLRDKLSRWRT